MPLIHIRGPLLQHRLGALRARVLLLHLVLASGAWAQGTYYVATSGNDTSGDGSSGRPWATISHALDSVEDRFRSRTQIEFVLSQRGPVRLDVFDAAGRRVRVLLEETRSAGEHFVTWDGRDARGMRLPAGVYLVRLHAGPRALQAKCTLMR